MPVQIAVEEAAVPRQPAVLPGRQCVLARRAATSAAPAMRDLTVAESARKSDFGSEEATPWGDARMCKLCEEGKPQNHFGSRRHFLKGAAAAGVAAAGFNLFA